VGQGLEAKGGKLVGFTIAGEDQKFHPAEAELDGDTVVVHSDAVAKPVAVRYAWLPFPEGNLWNKDGLPASPFRSDSFRVTTQDNK
jgi:sialate O-acetylesterase